MSRAAIPIATALLIAIGAIEARVSAQQISESVGRPRLENAGVMLTAAGLLASTVVYLVLGHLATDDRAAVRAGVITGVLAGLAGGALRAFIISPAVTDLVRRYAAVPDPFISVALGIFVVLSLVASAAGGGAITWTGRRISRAARSRPPA
jgi:hypothetical protein